MCKYETCTHISFLDVESLMHPDRIKVIQYAIQNNPAVDILLHAYKDSHDSFKEYNSVSIVLNKLKKAQSGCAVLDKEVQARIHHSYCTVKREVWDNIKFHEEKEYEFNNNSIFCGDVLAKENIQSIYIREALC